MPAVQRQPPGGREQPPCPGGPAAAAGLPGSGLQLPVPACQLPALPALPVHSGVRGRTSAGPPPLPAESCLCLPSSVLSGSALCTHGRGTGKSCRYVWMMRCHLRHAGEPLSQGGQGEVSRSWTLCRPAPARLIVTHHIPTGSAKLLTLDAVAEAFQQRWSLW